ncbi:MAG TPA: hypothetical protein V6D17_16125 [Candidatus Obscuribacterales bacterium]
MLKRLALSGLALAAVTSVVLSPVSIAAEEPVTVQEVTVKKKAKGGGYKVFARGTTPSAGWSVTLKPNTYAQEPEVWEISAVGTRPTGASATVVTPWQAEVKVDLGKKTKQIAVKGKNTIKKDVPQ